MFCHDSDLFGTPELKCHHCLCLSQILIHTYLGSDLYHLGADIQSSVQLLCRSRIFIIWFLSPAPKYIIWTLVSHCLKFLSPVTYVVCILLCWPGRCVIVVIARVSHCSQLLCPEPLHTDAERSCLHVRFT